MTRVGIVVALGSEQRTITTRRIKPGQCQRVNQTTTIAVSGIGSKNATAAAERLVGEGCQALLSWGCAGALDATLRSGDLLCPETVISDDGTILTTNGSWQQSLIEKISALGNLHTGPMIESAIIIESAADKQLLHQKTGAIAIDMESASVLRVAEANRIPGLVIRAVADPAGVSLPPAIRETVNRNGSINFGPLLLNIARSPLQIYGLIGLGMHFHSARTSLTRVCRCLASDFFPVAAIS